MTSGRMEAAEFLVRPLQFVIVSNRTGWRADMDMIYSADRVLSTMTRVPYVVPVLRPGPHPLPIVLFRLMDGREVAVLGGN